MIGFYVLDSDNVVIGPLPVIEYLVYVTAAKGEHNLRKRIARNQYGDYLVSTVFLPIDHGIDPDHPILFETMIFPLDTMHEIYCERCSDYADVQAMHNDATDWILTLINHDVMLDH